MGYLGEGGPRCMQGWIEFHTFSPISINWGYTLSNLQ